MNPVSRFSVFLLSLFVITGCALVTDGINYTDLSEPRFFYNSAGAESLKFDGTLKVVSYNIKFSKETDKAIQLLKRSEKLDQADIYLLQEMDENSVKKIAEAFNYNYIYYPAVKHPLYNRNFGNAIVTKWPIVFDQKVILPHLDPEKLQRIAVGAVVKVNRKYLMVYSVHMRIWLHPFQRKNQMDRLLHSIPPYFDHVIIGGDFNTFSKINREVIFDVLEKHRFDHASANIDWTYKHWYLLNKKSLMDYIFTRNMDIVETGTIESRRASDHLPIWSEIRFKDH